ncbi:MAG: SNF2 helicase associated domain-containing protein [Turicibacter sp.]
MNLNLNDIKDIAANPAVFSRAQAYYYNGAVVEYYVTYDSLDLYQVFAEVLEGSKTYKIHISMDDHSKVTDHTCDCGGFHTKFGSCKHVIAALLKMYDDQIRNKLVIHKGSESDDDLLLELIESYEEQLMNEISHEMYTHQVSLRPKLVLNDSFETSLEFTIGESRAYVVKDIFKLCHDIKTQQFASYGKELEFKHSLDNFEMTSQKLANFICEVSDELETYVEKLMRSKATLSIPTKDLYLANSNFDAFFDLYQNKTIACKIPHFVSEMTLLIPHAPQLEFKLEEAETDYLLSHNLGLTGVIEGQKYKYLVCEGHIYRCDKAFENQVLPLIDKMAQLPYFELKMNEGYMGKFLSVVLPKIKNYLNHSALDTLTEKFEVYPLVTKFYLDSEVLGSLMLRIEFHYGDVVIEAHDDTYSVQGKGILRDGAQEATILAMVKHYHFFSKVKGYLSLENEDEIYFFMQEGIQDFSKFGELYVSESFKKIKIKEPKTLSMGIRVDSELLKINFEELEFHPDEYKQILAAYRLNKKYFRLKDGSYLNIKNEYMDTLVSFVDDFNLDDSDLDGTEITLPKYRALYLDKLTRHHETLKSSRDQSFKSMVREFKQVEDSDFEVPDLLKNTLRNYQKTGYRWLKTLSKYEMGGILADDMGLGKTLQVISLLLSEKGQVPYPSIIICPSSLVYNWKSEIEKFSKDLTVCVINGDALERKQLIEQNLNVDVLVTSYDLMRRDIEIYQKLQFRNCVLDEAHYIKNHTTLNSKSAKKIKSDIRFALTGTPIENSLADLWSIFDFIMPGYLGSYTSFKKKYEVPIIRQNNTSLLSRLHQQVSPFILRRLKKDVLKELPDKIETVVYCEMEEAQRKLYFATLHQMKQELYQEVESNGLDRSRIKVLALLMRLRQLCCHPSLYVENYHDESTKLNLCLELVEDSIASGHKILIFSQFTSMLEIIGRELNKLDIEFLTLTGSTKTNERLALTEQFNQGDIPVFLISLKAGGTGLNLTGADVVIHYDPWWNMSAQNQATDRAHRIGQKQNVQVYKLIVKETIEEKIEVLQRIKMDLTESIVKEGETFISRLSGDEIVALFEDDTDVHER